MTLPFMAGSNFKLKTSLTGSRTFHLDACTPMEHAHPPYAHIVLQMSLTHWVKFKPKFWYSLHLRENSTLWTPSSIEVWLCTAILDWDGDDLISFETAVAPLVIVPLDWGSFPSPDWAATVVASLDCSSFPSLAHFGVAVLTGLCMASSA
jgi:hypothetical protein